MRGESDLVQRMDGHLGGHGFQQLRQAADVIDVSVGDDNPADVAGTDGFAEVPMHGLDAGEYLCGRVRQRRFRRRPASAGRPPTASRPAR